MKVPLEMRDAREQRELADVPYDRWITPHDDVAAEFHRTPAGFLIRFPGVADCEIAADDMAIACTPTPDATAQAIETVLVNSVLPVIGNHRGELSLHGSACSTTEGAAAFVGLSRRGKTTLAGAFARSGHPFLSEDVIALGQRGQAYWVTPSRPVLRLFGDSAEHLVGVQAKANPDAGKITLTASESLPFAADPAPLRAIYVLGPGEATAPSFTRLGPRDALAEVMQHAFVLDVEDKPRLRAHFERLSDLVLQVPFVLLDYPRNYDELTAVVAAVIEDLGKRKGPNR